MIVLHHLNNSRSHRIVWLLEELGMPYEVKQYQRNPTTMRAPPELKQVHPLGKSPVITDGGMTIAESAVILEYLIDKDGRGGLRPSNPAQKIRYNYWMHFAEGSLMPQLLLALVFHMLKKVKMPFFARPIARLISNGALRTQVMPQVITHLDFIEAELSKGTWFVGDEFSVADIQMSYPLEAMMERDLIDPEKYPRIKSFLERAAKRPAYQKALAYK